MVATTTVKKEAAAALDFSELPGSVLMVNHPRWRERGTVNRREESRDWKTVDQAAEAEAEEEETAASANASLINEPRAHWR